VFEDLHIDSLELIELMMALEDEFGVEIPDDIGKQMFVRQPLTIAVLAEIVARQWGTGKPPRDRWLTAKPLPGPGSFAPFTQYGGVLSFREWRRGPLHTPMAASPNGYPQLHRATDGMRCIQLPTAEVEIGSTDADALPDEKPLHRVALSQFLIDAEPVSVQSYARFLNSVGDVTDQVLRDWCVLAEDDRRATHFQLQRHSKSWRPVDGPNTSPL